MGKCGSGRSCLWQCVSDTVASAAVFLKCRFALSGFIITEDKLFRWITEVLRQDCSLTHSSSYRLWQLNTQYTPLHGQKVCVYLNILGDLKLKILPAWSFNSQTRLHTIMTQGNKVMGFGRDIVCALLVKIHRQDLFLFLLCIFEVC